VNSAEAAATVPATPCGARRGRPRSEAAEQSIVDAVLRLLDRGAAVSAMSVEGIAAEAGVGKATIYRRWPNKDALLLDVLVRSELPEPEYVDGTVRDVLVEVMEYFRLGALARRERASLAVFAYQFRTDPELYRRYHDEVITPRRASAQPGPAGRGQRRDPRRRGSRPPRRTARRPHAVPHHAQPRRRSGRPHTVGDHRGHTAPGHRTGNIRNLITLPGVLLLIR
jgi:AcrR family transcriptional regulator